MNKLTPEMRTALQGSQGVPVRFQDEESNRVYLLVDVGEPVTLPDEYIRTEVQKGIDAADRGEISTHSVDEIKAEGRRRLDARTREG